MEAVLKCNKGFSTTSKPGTLAPPKGIHFLHKALQNDKEKTCQPSKMYYDKYHKLVVFLLKVSKSREENRDCSSSCLYLKNLSCGTLQGNWRWYHRRNFSASA